VDIPSTPEPFRLSDILAPLTFGLLSFDATPRDAHLLGQHTVRMSPISTAHLNPHALTFCLPPAPSAHVLVPILVNNTIPTNVRYSFTPLGSGRVEYIELGAKELKAIEQARVEGRQVVRARDAVRYDEYDDEDGDEETDAAASLQKTQSLAHLRLSKPGTMKLERVLDSSNVAARLVHPAEVTVVPCPTAQYTNDVLQDVHCAGDTSGVDLTIDIRGIPPLSLRWSKDVNERKEHFLVEGIEDSSHSHTQDVARARVPQKLKVPLSLSLDALGKHTYTLESVIDGMGNAVHLNDGNHDMQITRSLSVLRRPSVSFKACGPGTPTSLLVGSDVPVTLTVGDSDALDGPWNIDVKFEPANGDGKHKPWDRKLQTQDNNNDVVLKATVPGEYSITGIKGKVGNAGTPTKIILTM
jgi:nucleoporin POM152